MAMAFPVFRWLPSFELEVTVTPAVLHVPLGDGFSAHTPVGLRRRSRVWSLRFGERSKAEAVEIMEFLAARDGHRPFLWTPPSLDTTPALWLAPTWRPRQRNGVVYEVATRFEEQ